jgi:hypothetical protein
MIWQATRLVILPSQDLHVVQYEIDQEPMILPDSYWDEEEMETLVYRCIPGTRACVCYIPPSHVA